MCSPRRQRGTRHSSRSLDKHWTHRSQGCRRMVRAFRFYPRGMGRKFHRYLNSAVLLADAGHSLSGALNTCIPSDLLESLLYLPLDLLGDLVTLFFYTLSRRTPSSSYPYGYGKFESMGTVILLLLPHGRVPEYTV
jgi:hypothetical protein